MHTLVVGAGSAGSVIAARLTESASHEVTLVEAGPDYPQVVDLPEDLRDGRRNSMSAHDWGYRMRNVEGGRAFAFPRGRVVGGSSAVNTCIALRGHPYDYDEWASLGLSEWSFEQCMPAFRRLENDLDFEGEWHGRGGPIPIRRHPAGELVAWQAAFVEASRKVGYPETVDHNNPDLPCGVGPHPMNKIGGERMSAARCYLTAEVRRRKNLTIAPHTLARRVLFEGRRFAGLEVERSGIVSVLRADRIVLSLGAIGTPGLLLRSGVGPRRDVERLRVQLVVDSPTVARRLLDHPGVGMLLAPRKPITRFDQPVIQTMVRYTSRGSEHPFDMQMQPASWLPIFGLSVPVVAVMAAIGKPRGHGTLTFTSSDPHARPVIDGRFLVDHADRARAMEALSRLFELARQPPLAELAFPILPIRSTLAREDRLEALLPRITGSGYHPCGTVPMTAGGISDGACDGRGRLLEVEGVTVADASLMPTIPTANTNLPTLMIGERIAEWLS